MILEKFDDTIEDRRGVSMKHVDALSRNPVMMVEDGLIARIRTAQMKDNLRPISALLNQGRHMKTIRGV